MPDDGIIAIDDGNHAFLTAELMPITISAWSITIVGVRIDYSKRTAFTMGTVKTNFGRFPPSEKLRFLTWAAVRHVVG
jgi:hypothetical protein